MLSRARTLLPTWEALMELLDPHLSCSSPDLQELEQRTSMHKIIFCISISVCVPCLLSR